MQVAVKCTLSAKVIGHLCTHSSYVASFYVFENLAETNGHVYFFNLSEHSACILFYHGWHHGFDCFHVVRNCLACQITQTLSLKLAFVEETNRPPIWDLLISDIHIIDVWFAKIQFAVTECKSLWDSLRDSLVASNVSILPRNRH